MQRFKRWTIIVLPTSSCCLWKFFTSIWIVMCFIQKALGQREQKGNGLKRCSCCVPIVCRECKAQQRYLKGRSSDAQFWHTKLVYKPASHEAFLFSAHSQSYLSFPVAKKPCNAISKLLHFRTETASELQFFLCVYQCCWLPNVFLFIWPVYLNKDDIAELFCNTADVPSIATECLPMFGLFLVHRINKCSASISAFFPLHTDINISPQIVMITSLHSHT